MRWRSWTLASARRLLQQLEPELAKRGWHCGLVGSVVINGRSDKDLDVIVYQHKQTTPCRIDTMREALHVCGLRQFMTREEVVSTWRRQGTADDKWVEIWTTEDRQRRIDLFVIG
jgi:hypothetical protein